ncbi:MAG: extracellular solute-binding protein [Eubacterium sp.]|nr:extracellular solute-binding protein [Eubacterium sp.]
MKKKLIITILIVAAIIVGVVCLFKFAFKSGASYVDNVSDAEFDKAFKLLNESYLSKGEKPIVYYTDFLKTHKTVGKGEAKAEAEKSVSVDSYYNEHKSNKNVPKAIKDYKEKMQELDYQKKAEYTVNVDADGLYYLAVDYISAGSSMSDYTVSVSVNGKQEYSEMNTICLPIIWNDSGKVNFISSDEKKTFPLDSHGDEMAPSQSRVQKWTHTYLYNNTYTSSTPLAFQLKKGTNKIVLENVSSGGLGLGQLQVSPAKDDTISYSDYAKKYSKAALVSDDKNAMQIDAVYYSQKNSIDAIYESKANTSLTRYDIDHEKLNTLIWSDPGTEVQYTVNVKKTGKYNLALHFNNDKKEFVAFETIKIDGQVPFEEMYNYAFDPTSAGYANEILKDKKGKFYEFYLTKGVHTITLKQENAPVMEAYRYALLLQQHITNFELEITKITGTEVDQNRNWKMTKYIKNIPHYLDSYEIIIQRIRYLLQHYSKNGNAGAVLTYLDEAEQFIDTMQKYPDEVALHTSDLTGADNSILVSLSNFTTEVTSNAFTLDRLYVCGDEDQIGPADASFFSSLWTGIRGLFNTFVSDKYSANVSDDNETITIWVNRAITHVDLLQKMADTDFKKYYKKKTGKNINVQIATMPDITKLTLAVAAKETPDIALGLMSYVPFDLSSRGALYDLSKFDDFWAVANRFPTGSFVSYVYNEGVYAVPETTDFNAIVYRKDIFKQLNLDVPNTWDDLIDILPTLQRYGKNFYHNISLGQMGYKWFYQTAPMILQNGGSLYVQDGSGLVTTGVDSKKSVKGLQLLGDLFTKYSLDTSVNTFFNSFRYSVLPIGIIGMEDYTLIKNGAQELDGEWGIAPYIGTVRNDEGGTVDRTFVANGTGGVIFKGSKKKDASWEFLKWWTSDEVQTQYEYTLRSSYGKTFFWLSANIDALKNNSMDEADKNVVLKQIQWVTDVTRTPGQYLLERTISNMWTSMVFDGTSAQVTVDESKSDVNKEIVRKMQELGYYDDNGKLVKKFKLQGFDWIKKNQEKAKKAGEEVK